MTLDARSWSGTTRSVLRVAVAVVGACLMVACSSPRAVRAVEPVWSDEFDGVAGSSPDPTRWLIETGSGGWGNQELQCYTDSASNTALDGQGHLVLTARTDSGGGCVSDAPAAYTSGRITTRGLAEFRHGRLEVRAKVPGGIGTWPAFWALGADLPEVGWPASGEIDVMEHVGSDPAAVSGTVHGPTAEGTHFYLSRRTTRDTDFSAAFHTFAVDWSSDSITWSVDGDEYATVTRESVEDRGQWVFDKPFNLVLNLAVGGTLGGPVAPETIFPQAFVVDYVRVWGTASE